MYIKFMNLYILDFSAIRIVGDSDFCSFSFEGPVPLRYDNTKVVESSLAEALLTLNAQDHSKIRSCKITGHPYHPVLDISLDGQIRF